MTPKTDVEWRTLYERRGHELVAVRAALDLAWETNEQLQRDNRAVLKSHQTMREELGKRTAQRGAAAAREGRAPRALGCGRGAAGTSSR